VTATGTRVDVQRASRSRRLQNRSDRASSARTSGAILRAWRAGLSLTGTGAFEPIVRGAPRTPTLEQIKVPKCGSRTRRHGRGKDARSARGAPMRGAHFRALGEVRLNVHKATRGLRVAQARPATPDDARAARQRTIWSASDGQSGTAASRELPSIRPPARPTETAAAWRQRIGVPQRELRNPPATAPSQPAATETATATVKRRERQKATNATANGEWRGQRKRQAGNGNGNGNGNGHGKNKS